jgi:gamma-glutamyltranspeptidase/glutathione hydrolase
MAAMIVSAVHGGSLAGTLSENDLASYSPVERSPLCSDYKKMMLCTFPPPSYGGVVVLEILRILERVPGLSDEFLDADFVHAFVEAGRIAETDRLDVVGDPDNGAPSVLPLLDGSYLDKRAESINRTVAATDPVQPGTPPGLYRPNCKSKPRPPSPSTSQLAIVDGEGGALSMTTTINVNFGSWLEVGGFFLNDALSNFTQPSDSPCASNDPAGNKRPETSMAPVLATNADGQIIAVGGSAGAGEIVDYVALALTQILKGKSPLEALDAGHVSTARAAYSDSLGLVELEQGRSVAKLALSLSTRGHKIKVVPLESGLGFLVWRNGNWEGAADPRRDGDWSVAK